MSNGFPNKPKISRGGFVEFGSSLPPLVFAVRVQSAAVHAQPQPTMRQCRRHA